MKSLEIEAGHRLHEHEGKCSSYHGHHYKFEVTVSGVMLDNVGRVLDFSEIKRCVGGWLDENWDHTMLLEQRDPLLGAMREMGTRVIALQVPPTAENLARLLLDVSRMLLPAFHVVRVRCWETPTCYAEAE